jgi:DHA1 family inner membrane transport protein
MMAAQEDRPASGARTSGFLAPVLAMTLCAFAIGTAEFVIAGLLPDISRDLGVSIPAAGQLVTAYAVGVVIGAPTLAVATARLPRKSVLLLMLAIFILGNLLSALSPNYWSLMAARIVAALAHGSLFGVGAVVVTSLAPENRRASVVALMFSGLTIANLAGVPLGTLAGQLEGWRSTFYAITALGALAFIAVAALIPKVKDESPPDLAQEFAVARRPAVTLALLTTVMCSACVFALFTYIVPILEQLAGFSSREVAVILFLIGAGLTLGITVGGKLADRDPSRALIGILAVLAALSFLFAAVAGVGGLAVATAFLWGAAAFAAVPPLQTRVLDAAKAAPNLASALNVGAFNLGNAAGALLGGAVLDLGLGLRAAPVTAGLLALAGLALAARGAARREPTGPGARSIEAENGRT